MKIEHFLAMMRSGSVGASNDEGNGGGESKTEGAPCNNGDVIKIVQSQIGVTPDGEWGPVSQAALDATGGSFKDFAPGCTGGVPQWKAGTGTTKTVCTDEGKACGKTGDCCGSLICEAGACVKSKSVINDSKGSASIGWIIGGVLIAATAVGIAYGTGSIGGPKKNPARIAPMVPWRGRHPKIDKITNAHVESGDFAYVEWIGSDGKKGRTEGAPDHPHMEALLKRAEREGVVGSRNPFTDPHTRYRVLDLGRNQVVAITHDPIEAGQIARKVRNRPNAHGAVVVRDVLWQGKWHQE